MTIRRRITVAAAVAVAISVVVVAVGAFLAARRQVLEPIDESLLRRAEVISDAPLRDLPRGAGRLGLGRTILLPGRPGDFDAVYYQIGFPDGSVINVGDEDVELPPPPEATFEVTQPTLRSVWVDDVHLRVATVTQGDLAVYVQIARPLTEADETLRSFAGMLAVGGLIGIAVAIGLGTLVSRNAVKPIVELQDSVSDVAESGDLGRRIDVDGDDEVAELAREFNDLLAQLDQSKAQQIRLVRDAGHELRTPLTALRMNLEVLQRHTVSPEDRESMLEAAHAEVEELSSLVAEIVDLATDRYEEEPVTTVALDDVVTDVVERLQRRNGRVVHVSSDGSVVSGKPEALTRAVTNIVANADAWSPEAGSLQIDVSDGTVTVTDEGPGFADHDLPHVFERFYRSDLARASSGSGLGLSIVEQIVTDHGGTTFARNRSDGSGAVVGFTLPAD